MKLYWMPYLSIGYPTLGPKECAIGKAKILPDSDETWQGVVKSQRPNHLAIHRDFHSPQGGDDGLGDVLFGTLVVSDDEEWLTRFIDEVVAIVYFIGRNFGRNRPSGSGYGRPAECFNYYSLDIQPNSDPDRLVTYWTKHGPFTDAAESIVVHPPLVTRGHIGRDYCLDLSNPEHQELIRKFQQNPQDRLVVAVRHFFRSQFSDIFRSQPAQDYALHCAAIEAALDLRMEVPAQGDADSIFDRLGKALRILFKIKKEVPQRGRLTDRFLDELCLLYGEDPRVRDFFHGLYACRSIHVHGIPGSQASEFTDKRDKAYQYFMGTKGKITITRAITRDIIERRLGRQEPFLEWRRMETAKSLLWMAIRSSEIWESAKELLTVTKAADKLNAMSDCEFLEKVDPIAFDLAQNFNWDLLRDPASQEQVSRAIVSCAIIIGGLTHRTGEVYAASDPLGHAAHSKNYDAIDHWTAVNVGWKDVYNIQGDRLAAYQQIAYRLALFFERR